MASEGTHEPMDLLGPGTVDRHRAIVSLMEELEAIDWYDQRIDATGDEELKQILIHNRDEEKEHAAMVLEWLRRRDPVLSEELRTHLFAEGPIREARGNGSGSAPDEGSLKIGSLRVEKNR